MELPGLFVLNAYVNLILLLYESLIFLPNIQLISYAGYTNTDGSITGDPINIEITEVT